MAIVRINVIGLLEFLSSLPAEVRIYRVSSLKPISETGCRVLSSLKYLLIFFFDYRFLILHTSTDFNQNSRKMYWIKLS